MIERWEEIASARTSAGEELLLRRRGGVFEIRCNGLELMSNRAHRSEEALAELALGDLKAASPRILVGGLGMGFTLRAALDAAPASAHVVVAELLPEIVEWNAGLLAPLAGRPLDDARVEMRIGDVAAAIEGREGAFDVILLDVDNGPNVLSCAANASLYSGAGLERLTSALAPCGVLAVWSADRSPAFEERLTQAGVEWRLTEIAARGVDDDPRHVIYLGRRD